MTESSFYQEQHHCQISPDSADFPSKSNQSGFRVEEASAVHRRCHRYYEPSRLAGTADPEIVETFKSHFTAEDIIYAESLLSS